MVPQISILRKTLLKLESDTSSSFSWLFEILEDEVCVTLGTMMELERREP